MNDFRPIGTFDRVVSVEMFEHMRNYELLLGRIALFLVGFGFEAAGDWQMARFKADPANRGRVCDRGFWRLTRHPNYFGEAVLWWGLWCVAGAAPGVQWTVVGPLLLTWLLLRVSGVRLLESDLLREKPAYRDYVARTSAFLPMPPRRVRER